MSPLDRRPDLADGGIHQQLLGEDRSGELELRVKVRHHPVPGTSAKYVAGG